MDRGVFTLLQAVAERSAYWRNIIRRGGGGRKWQFKSGTLVYNNPSIQCCYCKEFVQTNLIWVIKEFDRKVIHVWKNRSGKGIRVPMSMVHPHVGGSGAICMGNTQDVGEALFMGLNPDSSYHNIRYWLRETCDHKCWGDNDDDGEDYDDSDGFTCSHCNERNHIDDSYTVGDSYYCETCYNQLYAHCSDCDQDYSIDSDEIRQGLNGIPYCAECWSGRYFSCSGCGDDYSLSDSCGTNGDLLCQDCGAMSALDKED